MSDLSSDRIKWVITKDDYSTASIASECQKLPEPKYSVFGERIRHVAPSAMQCSMFCGGKQCKYCNPAKFKKEPNQDAIGGLYSAWVTSDILATSRPSTEAIKQYNIIEQFQKNDINSIINLQHPGEHAACGFGLEDGGFSYSPQEFMDNGVFFYNFGWNDYGVRSLQSILDMVKVFDFALNNGKAAVHCHAGLGRTGVLIACYLIYSTRVTSHEAIMRVREARPKAIQTRGQINCVNDFAAYIKPMWKLFHDDDDVLEYTFTINQFMTRQRHLLHGEEARTLRFLPKVVYAICSRLLVQADIEFDLGQTAIVTHFGFMRNSSFQSSKECEEQGGAIKTKVRFPIEGEIQVEKKPSIENHKYHSDEEIMDNIKTLNLPSLKDQTKARSTPNVAMSSESSNLIDGDVNELKKGGGVHLEPLEPRKTKRKKKKGLQERVKELKAANGQDDSRTRPDDDNLSSSLPPILKETDSPFDTGRTVNGMKKLKKSFKPDSISLASFSSTANEGLSQSEMVLKHLAFRTSDLTVSTQIERYKRKLNTEDTAWEQISQETSLAVLSGILWSWLSQLQSPLVTAEIFGTLRESMENHEGAADSMDKDTWKLVKFFVVFLSKLDGKQEYLDRILRRFAVIMTNDDFTKEDVADVALEDASPGLIFFNFTTSWLNSVKSDD